MTEARWHVGFLRASTGSDNDDTHRTDGVAYENYIQNLKRPKCIQTVTATLSSLSTERSSMRESKSYIGGIARATLNHIQ